MTSLRKISNWADPLDGIESLAGTLSTYVSSPDSLAEVCRRHETGIVVRFVSFNTFLMLIWGPVRKGQKPAVYARAREIGSWLLDEADLAALSEVWEADHLDLILRAWPSRPPLAHGIADRTNASSGLVTINNSTTLQLASYDVVEYDAESMRLFEDGSADKGILTTRFDTPFDAPLHVVSTHLDASDDGVRVRQLFQLSRIVDSLSRDGGHMIVTGDFNFGSEATNRISVPQGERDRLTDARQAQIDAFSGTGYDLMRLVLGWHGLRDLWVERGRGPGFTAAGDSIDLSCVCTPRSDHPAICDDLAPPRRDDPDKRPWRLDYVFITGPTAADRYRLDTSRPWRPNIRRPPDAPDYDEIQYLSDHLPLRANLLLSPV